MAKYPHNICYFEQSF